MTEDNENVVQNEEQTSQESASTGTGEAQAQQPLTAEAIQEMIDKAVLKATEQAKETGRRELQRQQDRNKAVLEREQRRSQSTEGLLRDIRTRYQEIDPEVAKDLELEELRAREKSRTSLEQEEEQRRQQEAAIQVLQTSLVDYLKSLDIDPEDKRIDWADDAKDYVTGRSRFDASVVKIIKENQKTMQDGFEKRLKTLEDKLKEGETEANSVETETSPGVVSGSDAEFMQNFGSGKLPMTKENIARYEKIVKTYG